MRIAVVFILGGVLGGFSGVALGKRLAKHRSALQIVFAIGVVTVGVYVVGRGAAPLLAR